MADDTENHTLILLNKIRAEMRDGFEKSAAEIARVHADVGAVKADIARTNATVTQIHADERVKDIAELLSVTDRAVQMWTKDERKAEKEAVQAKAFDLWLDCESFRSISATINGYDEDTVGRWVSAKTKDFGNADAPASRQHFDVWQFATSDKDAGAQSYFGALPRYDRPRLLCGAEEEEAVVNASRAGGDLIPFQID